MYNISIDLASKKGAVKPMHSVNNGPVYKFAADQRITNIDAFREAGIPYARNHDAAFYATYGGEHIVDVNFIFPNFDADPYDPASYDFHLTDEYIAMMEAAGTKCFYRLGSKIEHWVKKYNTLPPKDFRKWAVICEHIVRHYNEGWANGQKLGLEYWEIWNEPDLVEPNGTKPCWGGTPEEFYELYRIAAKHLRACFPNIKIGGPAVCSINSQGGNWTKNFLESLDGAPLDFFSWHCYARDPEWIKADAEKIRGILDSHGYTKTESILNEWNYVKGWSGEEWEYSLDMEKGIKGAAFIAGVMCDGQNGFIDNLMYYDARPCAMNGMFGDIVCDLLKGYYPFKMFGDLYRIGTAVESESDCKDLRAVAAANGERASLMVTHFNDDDETPAKEVKLSFKNTGFASGMRAEFYLLDDKKDMALVKEEFVKGDSFDLYLKLDNFATYFVKFMPL